MSQIIMCVDMDAFFASVEQKTNPRLRGKPIAVTGSGARTVITTSSYEARRFGVKTGMNVYEAKKLCPHIIFVIGDNEKYTYIGRKLAEIYNRFTPEFEIYSIDEAFLDITATGHLFGGPEAAGFTIKDFIRQRFGINCTVGIGPNVLIAKLASDIAKPDGLKRIKPEAVEEVIEYLPVKDLWGIGTRLALRLEFLGIRTCGELGRAPVTLLRNKFGILGEHLKAMGMGLCARPVLVKEPAPKSIGHSMTLPRDIGKKREIEAYILKLSEMVGRRARKYKFMGRKVSLTVRYPDFETFTKQTTLPGHTNNTRTVYQRALSILESIKLKQKVRLLGVCLSDLAMETGQMRLFKDREAKESAILQAMDAVNDRYGEFKLIWASCLERADISRVISPAWRPTGVRNVKVK
jgi:DNA polymerase-4